MGAGWHEKLRTGTHKNKFRTYTEYMTLVEEMLTTYPRYLRKEAIGKSVEGRELFVLNLQDHDSNLPKDKIFIGALTHAREAITCLAALDYIARTLEAIKNKDPEAVYVSQRRLVVVQPFINPDSYVANEKDPRAMIRKNRAKICTNKLQGVDLNRNFPMYSPATSANKQKCSDQYSSTEPFDQPETQAIKTVFDKHKFTVGLSLHAHGRMLIIPENLKPAERKFFDECRGPAKVKLYGTDMETVKYKAPGAMSAWFWAGRKAYGMCFEIGDAFWPTHGAKARLLKGTYSFIRFLVLKSGCQPRVDESGGDIKMANDGAASCLQLGLAFADNTVAVGDIAARKSSAAIADAKGKNAADICVHEKGTESCLCNAATIGGGKWVTKEDPRCAVLISGSGATGGNPSDTSTPSSPSNPSDPTNPSNSSNPVDSDEDGSDSWWLYIILLIVGFLVCALIIGVTFSRSDEEPTREGAKKRAKGSSQSSRTRSSRRKLEGSRPSSRSRRSSVSKRIHGSSRKSSRHSKSKKMRSVV